MARGFDLFNYWYRLYKEVTNKTLPPLNKISSAGKVQFNGRLTALKSQPYFFQPKDIKSLMLFALMHDPLDIPVEKYGDVSNLIAAAKHFTKWRRQYHDQMIEFGTEMKAIVLTAPTGEEQRFQLDESFEEQMEAFDPSVF